MKVLMEDSEKKFIMILCTVVIWLLVIISINVANTTGLLTSVVDTILASSFLMTMVLEAILATLIMALGLTAYVSVKQQDACKKAEKIMENEKEEVEEKNENIVE